jgi:hypothetical protein
VLTGLHAQFLHMVKCACKFEDWGIAVDLICYWEYDEEFNTINTKIKRLQLDVCAIDQDRALCEQQLEASRCAEGLTHLEGLGLKSAHTKWGLYFTDNNDDEEHVCINCSGCQF